MQKGGTQGRLLRIITLSHLKEEPAQEQQAEQKYHRVYNDFDHKVHNDVTFTRAWSKRNFIPLHYLMSKALPDKLGYNNSRKLAPK